MGSYLPDDEAKKIALGDIDPITKEEFEEIEFPNDSTAETINYTKSKLPQIMREKGTFKDDRTFWAYYNRVKRQEEEAGLIEKKPAKGRKKKAQTLPDEIVAPKKRGRKRKQKEQEEQESNVFNSFISEITVRIILELI